MPFNSEVYRDAFAPRQDTRRPRAWERSSVPAHAPRLKGQRIWKKAGLQLLDDKENEISLFELQSEGTGSRKKPKLCNTKEDIRDARWEAVLPAPGSLINSQRSTETGDWNSADTGRQDDTTDDMLQFVPRKRTNTDHVITPKKPMRQMELDSSAQMVPLATNNTLANISTRRKKSLRRSSTRRSAVLRTSTRFTSGNRPAHISEDTACTAASLQQPLENASNVRFDTEPSAMANHTLKEVLTRTGLPDNRVMHDNTEMDIDSDTSSSSTFLDTQGTGATKRASLRRDSKRASRNSTKLRSITEDVPPNTALNLEESDSQLNSGQGLCKLSEKAISSGDGSDVVEVGIQSPTRLCVIANGNAYEATTECRENHHSKNLIVALSPEPMDTLPFSERELVPSSPSEQLRHEAVQQQAQIARIASPRIPNEAPLSSYATQGSEIERLEELVPPVHNTSSTFGISLAHDDAAVEASSPILDNFAASTPETVETSIVQNSEDTSKFESIAVAEEAAQLTSNVSTVPVLVPVAPRLENTPSVLYEEDDTDMLRKFLTRVKADKAAKAATVTPQRKRSLPHSPLRLPLGEVDVNSTPSPLNLKRKSESTARLPSPSPKRRKRNRVDSTDAKSIRRSGRTRLPVKAAGTPSLIPVRRLGQDVDSSITLRQSEQKDLAALTRVNTRKNKGTLSPTEVLILKAAEKTDPVLKQRLLKEMFEEKQKKKGQLSKKVKRVAWAKDLTQFQSENASSENPKLGFTLGRPAQSEQECQGIKSLFARL